MADKYPGWTPYNYCFANPVRLTDPDGRDPFKRAKKYVAKNNIAGARYTTNSKGGVFVQWGGRTSDGGVEINGKQFNQNLGDKMGSFFSKAWNGFKKFDASLEGHADPANTGRITEQDIKVGGGVVSAIVGAATLGGSLGVEAAITGGSGILSGINGIGANSNGETLLQQQCSTLEGKQAMGNFEDGASILFGGIGVRSLIKIQ